MNFFNRFFKRNKDAKIRPQDFRDFTPSSSGIFNKDGVSFACINIIATEFAKLSFGVYDKNTHQKIKNNFLYELIKKPNLEENHFLFFYNCVIDYFNKGVFLYVMENTNGTPISLFRLNPDNVNITRDIQTNKRIYNYNGYRYTDNEVLYISSRYNYSTLKGGDSIFNAVHGTFTTANALESYTANSFINGIYGKRLVVDISEALPDATEKQIEELKTLMTSQYSGIENAGKPLFKKRGINYSEIGSGTTDNKSAELKENRALQKADVSMLFGVPLELLNSSSSLDVEKAFLLLNEFGVQPIALQFQEAFNDLLNDDYCYFEYNYNAILKTSLTQRIDAYNKQINNGLLSPNEARQKENMPPVEAGDTFFIPSNLMPLNEETINAYMAKQKAIASDNNSSADTSTDNGVLNSQHSPSGDDKQ